MLPYLLSAKADAWFISLFAIKFLISEKYESSFSSKSAWLSDSEFGEEALVPRWFVMTPECWLTEERNRKREQEKQLDIAKGIIKRQNKGGTLATVLSLCTNDLILQRNLMDQSSCFPDWNNSKKQR